ncbi:MAG TPA: sulfite oxidase-like oxidoreductase [Bacteroidetes bacterium]|nr:sulfite oxidase-like oxidoreductase [Bacteroidota bacterium]HRR08976.1 sulfite oxidase-like oxidoreductase [Rhodothermales bacterium]
MKNKTLPAEVARRIPPGQFLTQKFPVLTYGSTPKIKTEDWRLQIFGAVASEVTLTWDDLMSLPQIELKTDFHCVTTWSQLDNVWKGVHIREVLKQIKILPEACYVMAHAYGGYTTNMPLEVLDDDDVLLAYGHNGECLTPEHGFPMRLVIPKKYAWKSAKWLSGLEFMQQDRPGFWERNGYSMSADPWREERYW